MLTDNLIHVITAKKLAELLATLPGDVIVTTNHVGNLSIHRPDYSQVGYIEIGDEEVVLNEPF